MRVAAMRRSVAWISSSIRDVDRRGRVVEQQDLGIGEQRARQRDPLPLAAREREALLADDGVVAVGSRRMNSCASAARAAASISAGVASGRPNAMFARDRVGEEERVLEHDADAARAATASVTSRTSAPSIVIAPVVHVVEPRQQQADRRLARSRTADERDRLARRDREVEVAQHRLGRRVAERHVRRTRTSPVRHLEVGARRACPARAASSRAGRRCARRRRARAGRP